MDIILAPLLHVLYIAIDCYMIGLLIYGILLLIQTFELLQRPRPALSKLETMLFGLYDPFLAPIRKAISLKIDLSLVILYLVLYFARGVIMKISAFFPL